MTFSSSHAPEMGTAEAPCLKRSFLLQAIIIGLLVSSGLLLATGTCFAQGLGGRVVAWGDNTDGQTDVPSGLTNVVAIASGGYSCSALSADGIVTAWGDNSYGQTNLLTGISNVTAIAQGGGFSMVLFSDGTVAAWGDNVSGETNVPAGLTNVVAISAGNIHALALKQDGTVVAWGWNGLGQTTVPPGLNSVIAVAGGGLHSLALKSNGQVVAWGNDASGQTDVPAGLTDARAIAAGFDHSMALRSNGTVVAWGYSGSGQANVPAGLSNVVAIAAGDYHSLAVKADGTVTMWGDENTTPLGLYNVKAIAAGSAQNVAIVRGAPVITQQPSGQAVYSGADVNFTVNVGALGLTPVFYQWQFYGTNITDATNSFLSLTNVQLNDAGPYKVPVSNSYGTTTSSTAVLTVVNSQPIILASPHDQSPYLGANVTLTVTATGSLPMSYQWQFNGTNLAGETGVSLVMNDVRLNQTGVYSVVASNSFGSVTSSNAIVAVGELTAWGLANQILVPAGLTNVLGISAGAFHSLALLNDGTVTGWGDNTYGQTNIPSGLSNVIGISAGGFHSLALRQGGSVVGWGSNPNYEYGQEIPPPGLSNAVAVAAGARHSLVLKADGTVIQWGDSFDGAGTAPSGLNNVCAIAAGYFHNLALKNDGTVVGWGATTVPAGLSNVVAIAGGGGGSGLALKADGTVSVWGTAAPTGLSNVVNVAVGADHCLALESDGTVVAWGGDNWGQSDVPAGLNKVVGISGGEYFSLVLLSPSSPCVARQPLNESLFSGFSTFFSAGVVGAQPSSYQWQLNGTNVVGATNATLFLQNVQPSEAGIYNLIATNSNGTTTTSNATLNVITSPPLFVSQPTNAITPIGQNAGFNVSVTGSRPVSYQWFFNGSAIAGATNSSLSLSNIGWEAEGSYSVVISNQFGSISSPNVALLIPRARVVAWGDNTSGQTNVPFGLTNAIAITAGYDNSMVLKADGNIVGWGYNGLQQTTPPSGLSNVVAIATGGDSGYPFSLALKSDGTIRGWGNNTGRQSTPPADLSNVVAIAAGQLHGMAVRNDGRVFAWGSNSYGQTNVPALLSNATAIAAGLNTSLALRNDGAVVAWGDNTYGQTNVPPDLTNVTAIACGWYHCLALKNDQTVEAWGYNNFQETNVPADLSNVVAIAAGEYHSLAVKSDGTVVAWGQSTYHQTNVPGWLSHVVLVSGGATHSLGLVEDGPPVIFSQPAGQTNYAGFTTLLNGYCGGLQPIYLQWMFNGTNIGGATNSTLALSNLRLGMAGGYSFICSNAFGTVTSSVALIGVLTNSPSLALQPTNQTAIAGSNVIFSVAVGAGPIPNAFQWQFNGSSILGATNAVLTLTNVQPASQGDYAVVVDNGYGAVTSSNAYLTVIMLDLPTALNTPGWSWTTSGSAAWFPETTVSHDGVEAAQSGAVANGQSSTLQTSVTGPGTLTFWWMFSPGSPFPNTLSFASSLGNNSASVNSTSGWQQRTFYLGPGQQALTWNYSRNASFSSQSTGWLDQVSFTPGGTPPTVTFMSPNAYIRANSSTSFNVSAYGTPPLAYQWQLNGENLPGKTNAFLSLTGVQLTNAGTYTVIITNGFGTIATNTTLWVAQFAFNTAPPNFYMSTNGLQLQLDGILTTNSVVVFGSTDLLNWLPVFTNSATTGSVQFLDFTATNTPARFYRAKE